MWWFWKKNPFPQWVQASRWFEMLWPAQYIKGHIEVLHCNKNTQEITFLLKGSEVHLNRYLLKIHDLKK